MKPSVCRVVLAVGVGAASNGAESAPAIITRVWSQDERGAWLVNATILPDATTLIRTATSVYLFDNEELARASLDGLPATALYWPPRVPA